MRIHLIETGRLRGNATFLRGDGMAAALRRPRPVEFPVLSAIVEHPDGLIAIDTGLRENVRVPWTLRRIAPTPVARPAGGLAAAMRARGLEPEDVRLVVLTHLDWDHAGGVADLPAARVLVHRTELAAATRRGGRLRYQTARWPASFSPMPFDLDDAPSGPFPAGFRIADGIRAVPLPGHTPGQVGVVLDPGDGGSRVLLAADAVLRQDWLLDDAAAGRRGVGLGQFAPTPGAETVRRIRRLLAEEPTVLVPSHDDDAPARAASASRESLQVVLLGTPPSPLDRCPQKRGDPAPPAA
ncbi:MAG: N-acyl homoserine lactonase family protein [Thermoleophilia bacterium]